MDDSADSGIIDLIEAVRESESRSAAERMLSEGVDIPGISWSVIDAAASTMRGAPSPAAIIVGKVTRPLTDEGGENPPEQFELMQDLQAGFRRLGSLWSIDEFAEELETVLEEVYGTRSGGIYELDRADGAFRPLVRTPEISAVEGPSTLPAGVPWLPHQEVDIGIISGENGVHLLVGIQEMGCLIVRDVAPERLTTDLIVASFALATGIWSLYQQHRRIERNRTLRENLERQNDQLLEFADIVSHDLRNPLSIATGYLERAMETGDEEYLEEVHTAHERIDRIIQHTLTLAKEGSQVGTRSPVELARVANDAWHLVETKRADLIIDSSATIDADPDRLQQLFENLFRNAVEHAGSDATVRIGVMSGSTDETIDGFFVEDDGPGIPETERTQVFDQHYSGSDDGTGIGLHVVQKIATGHDWSVTAEEGEAGGARFVFRMTA